MNIEILPYRDDWAREFEELAKSIRAALDPLALRIDHIGSTAVPGLVAKDIIDIQLTVAELQPEIEESLARAGFQRVPRINADHRPPGTADNPDDWIKWFFKSAADRRPANLHVRIAGRANQRYPLLFRDYLRAHPLAAQAYANVKLALAQLHPGYIDAYCQIKDPVCDIIMAPAEDWAKQVRWDLSPRRRAGREEENEIW